MSVPLFEVSQTINDVTTSTSYGIGYGTFILILMYALAYALPTIFRLAMARFYPKKTILDEIDMNMISSLLPIVMSLFKTPRKSTEPSYPSQSPFDNQDQMMRMMQIIPQTEATYHQNESPESAETDKTPETDDASADADVSISLNENDQNENSEEIVTVNRDRENNDENSDSE
jgi:hypothetical protein